ncbi:MAG TPA: tripartite tricarboxylate transporter permease [Alphaproteobacteria bacterium]|nr:tripartite tricarboxylate transporter permease [Alphaproteobacteria bacterium]
MILELILSIAIGILIGIVTGLTPGVHINMVSLVVYNMSAFLIKNYSVSVISLVVFIIAVGITHTFLDSIPSIFLGAPNDSTALGILPGHRYLLSGNGLMAVKLFTIGSFFGLLFGIAMFPIFYFLTKNYYDFIAQYSAYILIAATLFMVYRDKKKSWAIFVVILSSVFGFAVFSLNIKDPLFPMLSGLFGISTLIISLNDENNIPKQNDENYTKLDKKQTIMSLIAGNISSFIVSTLPGLSSSIAAVISIQFIKNIGDKGFMILLGCIGTSSFILSLVALYTIDKARNGAVIIISKLLPETTIEIVVILLITAIIASAISTVLSLSIGRKFSKLITKINYKNLVKTIMIFVAFLVTIMTGWKGLIVLATSTAIGLIPGIVKVQRTHSMACIIVPVILYLL